MPGQLTRGAVTVSADDVLALGREPGAGQFLYRLGLANGGLVGRHRLPWAATSLLPHGAGLLIANSSDKRSPGLYQTDADGGGSQAVADDPVWCLERAGDRLLTLSRPDPAAPRILRVRDAGTLAELWSSRPAGTLRCSTATRRSP